MKDISNLKTWFITFVGGLGVVVTSCIVCVHSTTLFLTYIIVKRRSVNAVLTFRSSSDRHSGTDPNLTSTQNAAELLAHSCALAFGLCHSLHGKQAKLAGSFLFCLLRWGSLTSTFFGKEFQPSKSSEILAVCALK